jgi:IS1 family transposase
MANILPLEKQTRIIHALAEGSSILSIERMTGIHQDTIMRLGVRVGEACAAYMDDVLRELNCHHIQVDEIWGFIGKKQRNLRRGDRAKGFGDAYTFIALDPDSKLVASHLVGKRDMYHARIFMEDLAPRLTNRVQLSSDGLDAYPGAVERGFGMEVDYGQIVKTYASPEIVEQRRYSPPEVVSIEKSIIAGNPIPRNICTSHIEKQNHTLRMHCRRLTRLTNAFSKKLENFKAAVALNFAYYNFVKTHGSIRCTPAMAAGVLPGALTVANLVKMAR